MNVSGRESRERWPPSPPPPPHATISLSIATRAPWHISRHWGWQQATHCSESIRLLQPPQSTLSCRLVMYPDAMCEAGLVRNHAPHAVPTSVWSCDLNISSWCDKLRFRYWEVWRNWCGASFITHFNYTSQLEAYFLANNWKSDIKNSVSDSVRDSFYMLGYSGM